MANSRKPGILNSPYGAIPHWWPRKPGIVNSPHEACLVPPRTPGPLGCMDHGDPNYISLIGDTPGVLGLRDWADPSLSPGNIEGLACVLGSSPAISEAAAKSPPDKDPKIWGAWQPPADYAELYAMLKAPDGEGCYDYMYLDTQGLVTVGIGTCLRTVEAAKKLRFYRRDTLLAASDDDIAKAYAAVQAAGPNKAKNEKPFAATHYETASDLSMTPTDIGERWLADVKEFQRQLPTYFKGFNGYPQQARQALTDIAYQYGASGASTNAAAGAIKTAAESGDWAAAGQACAKLTYASASRNANRQKLFDTAASAQPRAKPETNKK